MQTRGGGEEDRQQWGGLRSSGSPGYAARGGSIYLPRREQVHGHRSVESAAPGEAQPAASLRHGPGQSDTEMELEGVRSCGPGRLLGVWGAGARPRTRAATRSR